MSMSLFCPPHDTRSGRVVLNVLERAENGPELTKEAAVITDVVVANDGHDSLGSLVGLVEGDTTRVKMSIFVIQVRALLRSRRLHFLHVCFLLKKILKSLEYDFSCTISS